MINTVSANTQQFQRHIRTINKSDEGFSSALSKQLEENYDFSDMYVSSHQTKLEDAVNDLWSVAQMHIAEMRKGCMWISMVGDMKELMESIEEGLAKGETLQSMLQNHIDKFIKEFGQDGWVDADKLFINPNTGEVVDSLPKGRCLVCSKKVQNLDYSTVKSQADDLATFLRYTVFKQEADDPEKVEALLSELKEKQSDYDTSRFLPIFSSKGEQGWKNARILEKMLGLDKRKWYSLSEEERDKLSDQLTDELMETLGEHYSTDESKDDGLHEEMKKMQFENVGKAKITWRVLSEL